MQHSSEPPSGPPETAADFSGDLTPEELLELADAIAAILSGPEPGPHP